MTLVWLLAIAVLASVGVVLGAGAFLWFPKRVRETLVPYLVSYATGTLLAAALLGLLPHATSRLPVKAALATVLAGLFVFFALERIVIWRHCHVEGPCEMHGTAGYLILLGDALHNFIDGVVMAAAFLTSVPLGIAAGLAVIAHEVPQEVGDFAILLDSGFDRRRALLWNVASGLATLPGALLGYIALHEIENGLPYVLAVSAASFLYIGLADLVPGLHGRIGAQTGVSQFLMMLAGVGTIILLQMWQGHA